MQALDKIHASTRTRTTKMIESVRKYCAIHSISYSYTMQMKRYVQQEHRRNEMQGHMPFLQHLPEGMIRELFQEARSPILHRCLAENAGAPADPSGFVQPVLQAFTPLRLGAPLGRKKAHFV